MLVDYQGINDIPDDFTDRVFVGCIDASIAGGFRLYCDYKFGEWDSQMQVCGTYYYRDSAYFYDDGRVRPNLVLYGPGYEYTKIYNVLFRMDHDITYPTPNFFYRWEGSQWAKKTVEGNYPDDFSNRDGFQLGYEWRLRDNSTPNRSYYVDPRTSDAKPGPAAARTCTRCAPTRQKLSLRTTVRR